MRNALVSANPHLDDISFRVANFKELRHPPGFGSSERKRAAIAEFFKMPKTEQAEAA